MPGRLPQGGHVFSGSRLLGDIIEVPALLVEHLTTDALLGSSSLAPLPGVTALAGPLTTAPGSAPSPASSGWGVSLPPELVERLQRDCRWVRWAAGVAAPEEL